MERLALLLPQPEAGADRPDFFTVVLTDVARDAAYALTQALRDAGFRGEMGFSSRSIKSAMRQAGKSGARFCLLIGEDELAAQTVMLKNMDSGEQSSVAFGRRCGPASEIACKGMFGMSEEQKELSVACQSLGDWTRTHTCGELTGADNGAEVCLMGWVQYRRDHGGLIFVDLRDRFGLTQIVFSPEYAPEAHEQAGALRSEYVLAMKGKVRPAPEGMVNPTSRPVKWKSWSANGSC